MYINSHSIVFTLLAGFDSLACWTEMPELLIHFANLLCLNFTHYIYILIHILSLLRIGWFGFTGVLDWNAWTLDSFSKPSLFKFHTFLFVPFFFFFLTFYLSFCFLSFLNLQFIIFTLLAGLYSLACWTEMPELLIHLANLLYLNFTFSFLFFKNKIKKYIQSFLLYWLVRIHWRAGLKCLNSWLI